MSTKIAIEIKNPKAVAETFGECAGDYRHSVCRWWVGTPKCLHPAGAVPTGVRIIHAPVKFCGGEAWISHPPRRPAPPQVEANSYRRLVKSFAGLVATGHVVRSFVFGGRQGAVIELRKLRAAPAPVLP